MHEMHGIRPHALALTFILAFAGEAWAQGDIAKRLIGTWRLVEMVNDKGNPVRGPHPTGLYPL
jgi:hypothetical protein